MTPVTLLLNVVLFLAWALRITSAWKLFTEFPLTRVRYPEIANTQAVFDVPFRIGFSLEKLTGLSIRPSMFLKLHLETNDPILTAISHPDAPVSNKVERTEGFFNPVVWLAVIVDSLLIGAAFSYFQGTDFVAASSVGVLIAALNWFGIYKLLWYPLVEDVLDEWISNKIDKGDLLPLRVVATFLLPFSTGTSVLILSLVQARKGYNWEKFTGEVITVGTEDPNTWGRILYSDSVRPVIGKQIVPEISKEFKNLLARRDKSLLEMADDLERIIESSVKKYIDLDYMVVLYLEDKIKRLINAVL